MTEVVEREPLRSYKLRRSRLTRGQAGALESLRPVLGLDPTSPLDAAAVFGRVAPLVLEIGSGMGEATVALAEAEPERDVLAVELHTPGIGSLLRLVAERGLRNVRVVEADARLVLRDLLAPDALEVVRVFFPDPWPKSRHHKRRLVDDAFASLVASRLAPGGVLHLATDWAHYARQMRAVLERCPDLELCAPPWRPPTRFEGQGIEAGRAVADVAAVRSEGRVVVRPAGDQGDVGLVQGGRVGESGVAGH